MTFFGNPPKSERWVKRRGQNFVRPLDVKRPGGKVKPGRGYPGTNDPANGIIEGSFPNAGQLVSPTTFVFVVDTDGDLTTYETFPAGRVIRIVIDSSVTSMDNRELDDPGVATSTVGGDLVGPKPLLDGIAGNVVTSPKNFASGVACDEEIRFSFDESCQPYSVGPLPSSVPPPLSNEFTVEFLPGVPPGFPPPGSTITVPYTVLPVSPLNFTEYVVTPVVPFPGSDPFGASAKAFVTYFHNAAIDLFGTGDPNSQDTSQIEFEIGDCPGLVNAPVSPGAIYLASNGGGTSGGIRVLDLDGYGQGTGDPTHNAVNPLFDVGDISKFPFNPNVSSPQAQFMFPPLSADNTTIAGGSEGVFTLTKDSSLSTQLVSPETSGTVADMAIGHPLDLVFNNFDCLSGGQNLCANAAFQLNPLNVSVSPGNSISHSPHPNPPRIRLAPSCFAPLIQTEEPTFGQANGGNATNLLQPGNAFGNLGTGAPPTGLLTNSLSYAGFWGPSPPSTGCPQFTLRQQVGHFLYVLDSSGDQVVVLNSNRMTVIENIPVGDPRDMAISPDMNLLAVSNKGVNTITIIDTDPNSPTFHTVIKTIPLIDDLNNRIGVGPTEVVWQPDDEDILVICESSNSMAIVSSGDLEVRKIIPGVFQPKLLMVSNRDSNFGFQTGLYYAFVIGQDGTTTIFESGPDGIQGIGFDDFVGIPALQGQSGFAGAAAIQPNPNSSFHSAYIAYRKNGQAAVADLFLKDAPVGTRQLAVNGFLPDPNFRSKEFTVEREYIGSFSSSSILDIAVDDLTNVGGTLAPMLTSGTVRIVQHSAKALVRRNPDPNVVGVLNVSEPQYLFAANANGKVDVIDMMTGQPAISAREVPGVAVLASYWRQ